MCLFPICTHRAAYTEMVAVYAVLEDGSTILQPVIATVEDIMDPDSFPCKTDEPEKSGHLYSSTHHAPQQVEQDHVNRVRNSIIALRYANQDIDLCGFLPSLKVPLNGLRACV